VLEQRLIQQQIQKLILSPQMQQALHLLQLPMMDLRQLLRQEMVQNPVLEEIPEQEEELTSESSSEEESTTDDTLESLAEQMDVDKLDEFASFDIEWQDYFQDVSDLGGYQADQAKRSYFESSITKAPTLQKHLLDQLRIVNTTPLQETLAEYLIGDINEEGYLEGGPFDVAALYLRDDDRLRVLVEDIRKSGTSGLDDQPLERALKRFLWHIEEGDSPLHRHLIWQLCAGNAPGDDLPTLCRVLRRINAKGQLSDDPETIAAELRIERPVVSAALGVIQRLSPEGLASDEPPADLAERIAEAVAASGPTAIVQESLDPVLEEAERAMEMVQAMDPPGVGARDLRECLLTQLRTRGQQESLAGRVVDEHLDDLEHKRYPQIARAVGVSTAVIQEVAECIGELEPKPGHQFNDEPPQYIIPDVILESIDGQYHISINDEDLPRLRISPLYRKLLAAKDADGDDAREYILSKFKSAIWLMRSIEQRRRTIYKVTECIVHKQREFLDKGIAYLKPLRLREVAEMVSIHESTVSRVTTNKYIQTPRGIFELKFFFSSGLDTDGKDQASAKSIKARIREMVEHEDSKKPLNDQKIADALAGEGVKIARRTVAKYREELGILPSSLRKQY